MRWVPKTSSDAKLAFNPGSLQSLAAVALELVGKMNEPQNSRGQDKPPRLSGETTGGSRDEVLLYSLGIVFLVLAMIMARVSIDERRHAKFNIGLLTLSGLVLMVAFLAPEQTMDRVRRIRRAGFWSNPADSLQAVLELLLYLLALVSVIFVVDYGNLVNRWFSVSAIAAVTFFRIVGYYVVHYRAKWRERKLRRWAKMGYIPSSVEIRFLAMRDNDRVIAPESC